MAETEQKTDVETDFIMEEGSSSETVDIIPDSQEYDLLKTEQEFLIKYGQDVADIVTSVTKEDLLSKEELPKILIGVKKPYKLQIPKDDHYNSFIACNMKAYYKMKNEWIQYYAWQVVRGYYTGNMAIVRCKECHLVMDCWPCKEKRVYRMPKDECGFCQQEYRKMEAGLWKAYDDTKPRPYWQEYRVKYEHKW